MSQKPTTTRKDTATAALGGTPIPVPGSGPTPAGRVTTVAPPKSAELDREPNPLFDAPSELDQDARRDIQRLRSAFASAMQAATSAADLAATLLAEGFDLTAAAKVAKELTTFVDKHKPKKDSDTLAG